MLPKETAMSFSIPPKLDTLYENFKLITETASHRVFEAQTKRNQHEKHLIRILDPPKDLVAQKFDSGARLFIKELSYLQTRCPGSVLINTLEISETLKKIACAIRHGYLIGLQLDQIQQFIDLNNPKVIEKLLNDVIFDLEFLWRDLKMKNVAGIIEPRNIYYLKERGTFFLGNWDKITAENTSRPQDHTSMVIGSVISELQPQDIATEIKTLAFALLKMKKVDIEALELLLSSKKVDIPVYEAAVKAMVADGFNNSQKLQNLVERMLSLDPKNLPNFEEFRIKEDKIQMPFEKTKNEASTVRKDVRIRVALEESKINLPSNSVIINSPLTSTPPILLAWSSYKNNQISIIDLETKQNYVTFDGARISDTENSCTHVKEIPNTNLLVSLHHNWNRSANLELYDISKKEKANKIYSLGEVSGMVGVGDVTYNSRRSIFAAISVTEKIAYHLFNVDAYASNAREIVKLNRKTRWSPYSRKDNYIPGFDFNPAGDSIATIDRYGVCLISDVNTNNYSFHIELKKADGYGRCRWSTNTGEAFLFVKYDYKKLNILDVEKKALILSIPVELEKGQHVRTLWIDACQSNGNLLASCGYNYAIKIFDKRESKIVKTFEGVHSSEELHSVFVVIRD